MAYFNVKLFEMLCSNSPQDKNFKKNCENSCENHTFFSSDMKCDRIKSLYPSVDEKITPLPRQWSCRKEEKCGLLSISHNDLRVSYKGTGKEPKDVGSIRTSQSIPHTCGIYYFEINIISKGKHGFMGVGVTAVQKMESRLPGWDKNSYGYHGDDGNSFCSSGQGQPYGPTFTTGDVIGCCVNFIDNTCFYTKNGVNLGIAFRDLPPNLYPTVGLQTPGEVVEANFGQKAFYFDFEDYVEEWKYKIRSKVFNSQLFSDKCDMRTDMQKLVLSYLVNQGYALTAECFSNGTGTLLHEDLSSVKNRQKIQRLILSGKISEAIILTQKLYPQLLQKNNDLHFKLKCRQFIEMINGTDNDSQSPPKLSDDQYHDMDSSAFHHNKGENFNLSEVIETKGNSVSNGHKEYLPNYEEIDEVSMDTSDIQNFNRNFQNGTVGGVGEKKENKSFHSENLSNPLNIIKENDPSSFKNVNNSVTTHVSDANILLSNKNVSNKNYKVSSVTSSSFTNSNAANISNSTSIITLVTSNKPNNSSFTDNKNNNNINKVSSKSHNATDKGKRKKSRKNNNNKNNNKNNINNSNNNTNNSSNLKSTKKDSNSSNTWTENLKSTKPNVTTCSSLTENKFNQNNKNNALSPIHISNSNSLVCSSREHFINKNKIDCSNLNIEKILKFGRSLHLMSEELKQANGKNEANEQKLKDAFSLLAYSDPKNSPVGHQLDDSQREEVSNILNSAILDSFDHPSQPALDLTLKHAKNLVKVMNKVGIASSAFATFSMN